MGIIKDKQELIMVRDYGDWVNDNGEI